MRICHLLSPLNIVFLALYMTGTVPRAISQIKGYTKPKLVLVLVVDQLRADQVSRFESRFLPARSKDGNIGGFRFLMEKGAYFPLAEHGNLQNMTGPGHATILSGAYPYQHGIVTNGWVDEASGDLTYCVADPESALVGVLNSQPSMGVSPKNLMATTFGDELKNSGYPSRVFSVALKDRAAVLLGGHRADLALWFDAAHRKWVSSRFYLPDGQIPTWLETFNKNIEKKAGEDLVWEASGPGSGTSLAMNKDLLMVRGPEELKANFPHKIKLGSLYSSLLPFGTEMTIDLALQILDEYQLGTISAPDVLAVSLSNHDFISHAYGPNSRETEEITVAEDQQIARLLQQVDKKIGLDQTLVVLTADHGASPQPEVLQKARIPAGRIDEDDLKKQAEIFIKQKFGSPHPAPWILHASELNVYLNHKAIAAAKLDLSKVQDALAGFYREQTKFKDHLAFVFSGADVKRRSLPPGMHEQQILHTYLNGRNGDVMLIPRPYFINTYASTTHITGYAYDRIVPLFFAGKGINPGRYGQKAQIIDIASTLAFMTGTTPPSGSEGRVLYEILKEN